MGILGQNDYWLFDKELSEKTCDKIIKHGKKLKQRKGFVGGGDRLDKDHRNSQVAFLNNTWVYDIIDPLIRGANVSAGWNLDIDWNEDIQFTRYTKSQHYDWHWDSIEQPYRNTHLQWNGKIRKLSCAVSLTDPKKYEGGEFYFGLDGDTKERVVVKIPEMKNQGSVLVFPSFIYHKITPVVKGVRYSLVNWALGLPFK